MKNCSLPGVTERSINWLVL